MLRLSARRSRDRVEQRELRKMLTSGSGWRRRWIDLTTPPTLKPTRSHSEGRWTSETNGTSATNKTGGYSTTRQITEDGDSHCLREPCDVPEACQAVSWMD